MGCYFFLFVCFFLDIDLFNSIKHNDKLDPWGRRPSRTGIEGSEWNVDSVIIFNFIFIVIRGVII